MDFGPFAPLISHIKKFATLSDADAEALVLCLSVENVKKKSFLLQPGQVCHAHYFVVSGCLRAFVNDNGNEQVLLFAIENWWMTDYDSLESFQPSVLSIQALEDTQVIKIERNVREGLFKQIPALERYFRIILQKAYTASQRRVQYIYNLSGEERYRQFSTMFPQFVQRIPQYMLASYLGFTPEFLSKIRAKKS